MTNKEEYKAICSEHPEIPVYAQYWWLDAISDKCDWDVIVVRDGNGNLTATMPYVVRKRMCFTTISYPIQSPLLGIHFFYPNPEMKTDNYERQTFEEKYTFEILNAIEKMNPSLFSQNFSTDFGNHLPFFWHGYSQSTRYTYKLESIEDLDSVFNNLRKSKQKQIRKAQREGLTTSFDMNVDDFIEFHKYTYKKRGEFDLICRFGWEEFLHKVADHPNTRFVGVRDKEGTLLSVFFLAWDSRYAYYLLTGIDQDKKSLGAPSLMLWDTFLFLQGKTKGFDFEGSMTQGIGSSHREFGAKLFPYLHIYKYYSTPFRLLGKLLGKKVK